MVRGMWEHPGILNLPSCEPWFQGAGVGGLPSSGFLRLGSCSHKLSCQAKEPRYAEWRRWRKVHPWWTVGWLF